jgi:hypothetical protein
MPYQILFLDLSNRDSEENILFLSSDYVNALQKPLLKLASLSSLKRTNWFWINMEFLLCKLHLEK